MRTQESAIRNIAYHIKIRDYLVNLPMTDYPLHSGAIDIVIRELDRLSKEYRNSYDANFNWTQYQFTIQCGLLMKG